MFCWYYQWKISKLADENRAVLSHEVAEHLRCCDNCRRFYHLCRGMEQHGFERPPVTPQAAVEIQQKIIQKLCSGSDVQRIAPVRKHKTWMVAAAVMLLMVPAAVMWVISADLSKMLKKEQVNVSGLTRLSQVMQERWMNESLGGTPARRYLVEPYQKQLGEMTRTGRQAAAFMFACLDPGLRLNETTQEEQDSTLSQ